jgi:hypothetical protein
MTDKNKLACAMQYFFDKIQNIGLPPVAVSLAIQGA